MYFADRKSDERSGSTARAGVVGQHLFKRSKDALHGDRIHATPTKPSTGAPSDDDGEEFLNDWDEWSEGELGHGPKARSEEHFYNFNLGKIVTPASVAATTTTSCNPLGKAEIDHIVREIPCMPCVDSDQGHRDKLNEHGSMKFGKFLKAGWPQRDDGRSRGEGLDEEGVVGAACAGSV